MRQQQTENQAKARKVDTLHNINSFRTQTIDKFADQCSTLHIGAKFYCRIQTAASNPMFE
jgi:hypothetical protein